MIETTAWIVGILALLVGIPVSYLITLRLAKLHSKKMAAGGQRGAGNAGASPSGTATNGQGSEPSWYIKHWVSIALVLAGAAIFFWGLYTPGLKLRQVGDWSWDNWFWLLAFGGILIALSKLNAQALGDLAKKLERGTIAAWLILFLGFPVWYGIGDFFSSKPSQEKPTLLMPANGDSPRVETKPGHFIRYTGSGFEIHCVYRGKRSEGVITERENTCKDGPMSHQYVRDTTGKPNSVTYEFVRKK